MEEKSVPLDSSEDGETRGGMSGRHRKLYRKKTSHCDGRLWIFLVLGAVILVFGIVITGIYFNIRTLTESLQYTEVLPTYVNAVAVILSGFSVVLLFWRRLVVLVCMCVAACASTALLCAVTAILTGTHVIQPIKSFLHCTYYDSSQECHCISPYKRSKLDLQYSDDNPANYVFKNTSSCHDIDTLLLQILYGLTGVYAATFLVCVVAALLSLLVLRMERIKMGVFEDDTYEEIFTVSNSSTSPSSDSDNENQHMIHSAITHGDTNLHNPNIIRRCRSFNQPRFLDTTDDSVDTTPVNIPASTLIPKQGSLKDVPQGKLKENRRRHRRAVTLHNLDTRQLMVILSLQMRYLQENENAKSQAQLNAQQLNQQLRRALTPQPNREKRNGLEGEEMTPVHQIRSHTPQPYHSSQRNNIYANQQNYENMFDPTEFVNQLKQQREEMQHVNQGNVPKEVTPTQFQREVIPAQFQRETSPQNRREVTPGQQNYQNMHEAPVVGDGEQLQWTNNQGHQRGKSHTSRQRSLQSEAYETKTIPPGAHSAKNKHAKRVPYYEEIDDMAHCLDENQNQQIYRNQAERENTYLGQQANTDYGTTIPGRAVQVSSSNEAPKRSNIIPALYPSIPRHLFDRSDTPSRPKSYLNAVEGPESPQQIRRDQNQLAGCQVGSRLCDDQTALQRQTRLKHEHTDYRQLLDPAHAQDIYAQPVKKQKAVAQPLRGQDLQNIPGGRQNHTLPGENQGRSAFQVVGRNGRPQNPNLNIPVKQGPSLQYLNQPQGATDNNADFYPVMERSTHASVVPPPPYSPPPSYTDVITHSRDNSLHSLTSTTSSSDDTDIYQQINKPRSQKSHVQGHVQPWQQSHGSHGNSAVYSNRCAPSVENPTRKHVQRRDYENVQDPPIRGPRSGSHKHLATQRRKQNIPCEMIHYGQVFSIDNGESSDSDFMETVI